MSGKKNSGTAMILIVIGGVAILTGAGAFLFDASTKSPKEPGENWNDPLAVSGGRGNGGFMATPFIVDGIRTPETVSAAKATLADDEQVIGIVVKGKPRAYRVKAMEGTTGHVVNDLIKGTAVTVTYCDRERCAKAFTGAGEQPLPIKNGGYINGLIIMIDQTFYHQKTLEATHANSPPPFPFSQFPCDVTTWKEWKAKHPQTEVYETNPRFPSGGQSEVPKQ